MRIRHNSPRFLESVDANTLLDLRFYKGVLTDYSSYVHTISNIKSAQFINGYLGKAISFNGTSQYLSVTPIDDLLLKNSYTINFLCRLNDLSRYQSFFVSGNNVSTIVRDISINFASNTLNFHILENYPTTYTVLSTPYTDKGTHLVTVTSNGNDLHTLYLDGVPKAISTKVLSRLYHSNNAVFVGCDVTNAGPGTTYAKCDLDFFRIDKRVWTKKEIEDFYNDLRL